MKSFLLFSSFFLLVNGQGYMPLGKLRKVPPAMDGQSNDVYQEMERRTQHLQNGFNGAALPDGMAVLYASAPIFSPIASKDPEGAAEVYSILPISEAVEKGVGDRRLLEDALLEMGFPLEELTEFDSASGRVRKITSTQQKDGNPPDADTSVILAALQGPVPYIRRGAWGRK